MKLLLDVVCTIPEFANNSPSKDMVLQQVCILNVQNVNTKLLVTPILQKTWRLSGQPDVTGN
jgi:hypothetical protein